MISKARQIRVVDASVVAAAIFQEASAAAAMALLSSGAELMAPDLIYAELGNVCWKRFVRKEIDEAVAKRLLVDVQALPLRATPCAELAGAALAIALRTGRTVYDCLYLALAVRAQSVLVTADQRLVRGLAKDELADQVQFIGDAR